MSPGEVGGVLRDLGVRMRGIWGSGVPLGVTLQGPGPSGFRAWGALRRCGAARTGPQRLGEPLGGPMRDP